QNYPNPFNPSTTIEYSIPVNSTHYKVGSKQYQESSIQHQVSVSLKVYDILGREVTTLVNKKQQPGHHLVKWNGANNLSGTYFYRIQIGDYTETKKMLLIK
ncbi:MAG: T9SS type A sorting domain-containing protein, partial [Bacteroidota bacterium]